MLVRATPNREAKLTYDDGTPVTFPEGTVSGIRSVRQHERSGHPDAGCAMTTAENELLFLKEDFGVVEAALGWTESGWHKCPKCGGLLVPVIGKERRIPARQCACGHSESATVDDEWFRHWFFGESEGLGMCGCFMPDAAVLFLRDALRCIADAHETWKFKGLPDGALHFVWSVLASKNLTEHGSSLPGWLTGAGKALLEYLEKLPPGESPLHDENLDRFPS